MPRSAPPPQAVESMTSRQLARRDALLAAVMELAQESGLESVQMKMVAERSGVALGTTYRYFASKEHLLATAMLVWHGRYADHVLREARSAPAAPWEERVERVVAFMRRGITGFARYPSYADLLVFVTASRDEHALAALDRMNVRDVEVLRAILGREAATDIDTFTFIASSIWLHVVIMWRADRIDLDAAYERCEHGIRLVCQGLRADPPTASEPDRVA